jgi:hypothetical protein
MSLLTNIPQKTISQIQSFARKYELDYNSQLLKLEEELKEVKEATTLDEIIKELADIVIVLQSALSVFPFKNDNKLVDMFIRDLKVYTDFIGDTINYYSGFSDSNLLFDRVINEVINKVDINDKRTWIKLPDGRLKHVEESN